MWLCVLSYTSIFLLNIVVCIFLNSLFCPKKNFLKLFIFNSLKGFWMFLSENQNLMIILNQNDMFMQRYTCRSKPQSWNEMTWLTHTHTHTHSLLLFIVKDGCLNQNLLQLNKTKYFSLQWFDDRELRRKLKES